MRYQDFERQFTGFPVFSLADVRKIDPGFHRRQLSEWQDKGYIKKLRRGYYIFADTTLDEDTLFFIANHLYAPSYVSFESALSYHGLIPEGVYTVTSASGKKTAHFVTPVAAFSYRHLKPELLFGYDLVEHHERRSKIASIEKAVLDYLYLNPQTAREADFHEWRFESAEFLRRADLEKLRAYAAAFKNAAFSARIDRAVTLMRAQT